MKLLWSPMSPFVRKVWIVLHETGLISEVELERNKVMLHQPTDPELLKQNPLGKIPALVLANGQTLMDSKLIAEYLNTLAKTGLFGSTDQERLDQLRWQMMADGLTDILLLWRTELNREGGGWPEIMQGWQRKCSAVLDGFEAEIDTLRSQPFGIGQIALICALGQLDFRWSEAGWREAYPKLAAYEAEMATRSSVELTKNPVPVTEADRAVTRGHLVF